MQLLTRGDESFRWCVARKGESFRSSLCDDSTPDGEKWRTTRVFYLPVFLSFENLPVLPSRFPVLFLLLETLFLTNKGVATISQRLE